MLKNILSIYIVFKINYLFICEIKSIKNIGAVELRSRRLLNANQALY